MNLRDKLNIYGKKAGAGRSEDHGGFFLEAGARPVEYRGARLWRFEHAGPLQIPEKGPVPAGEIPGLAHFFRGHGAERGLALEDLLFLDLETTSLATGTGTYAFLIGVGAARGGEFRVEQFFMDDYAAEGAILEYVLPRFQGARAAVTFNGKAFDMPLLKNRYRINRVPHFPVDMPVIDLLHPARRLYRNMFEDCSLRTLEEMLLGVRRPNDIPGWLIPEAYFSFQRRGETGRIPDIVEHNRLDITSLLALLFAISDVYRHVEGRSYEGLDRRVLLNCAPHLYGRDIELFLHLLDFLGREALKGRSLFKKYSTALKRTGRLDKALAFWRDEGSVFSLEELAKHFEHRERDAASALRHCREAQDLLDRGLFSPRGDRLEPERLALHRERFRKRLARLERKREP